MTIGGVHTGFGERLSAAIASRGRLCVGIDPHPWLLRRWELPDDPAGVREFGLRVVDAAIGRAAVVKPQVAFFERHGSAGYAALEEVLSAARAAGLLVIADVKRGDVGSSVEAYAQAWLTPGSPLESDAITVSAFQGFGSLDTPLALAASAGKGVFVLAATSNPEAAAIQTAMIQHGSHSGRSVAAGIVADVTEWNRAHDEGQPDSVGAVGLVIGATVVLDRYGLDPSDLVPSDLVPSDPVAAGRSGSPATPILAPGFGHQGARLSDIGAMFGAAAAHVLASASRSILDAGADGIADAISAHAAELETVARR